MLNGHPYLHLLGDAFLTLNTFINAICVFLQGTGNNGWPMNPNHWTILYGKQFQKTTTDFCWQFFKVQCLKEKNPVWIPIPLRSVAEGSVDNKSLLARVMNMEANERRVLWKFYWKCVLINYIYRFSCPYAGICLCHWGFPTIGYMKNVISVISN